MMLVWAPIVPLTAQTKEHNPAFQALYQEARTAFDSGEYERSAELLAKAYALNPEPKLLWNRARSLQLAEKWEEALATYRAYLKLAPTPEEKQETETRIAEVKVAFNRGWLTVRSDAPNAQVIVDDVTTAPAPIENWLLDAGKHSIVVTADGVGRSQHVVTVSSGEETVLDVSLMPAPAVVNTTASGDEPMGDLEIWGWSILGAGAAIAIGGGVMLALGHADADEVNGAETDPNGVIVGLAQPDAFDLEESAKWKSQAGVGLLAAGGAAVVTGVVLLLVDAADDNGSAPKTALWMTPDSLGVSIGGGF
ncbi:MAG: PEGA domain-containing protein [Myxococcales bacterium]|nr:PEGA domain-containing protein [Myxococcales bacterium]